MADAVSLAVFCVVVACTVVTVAKEIKVAVPCMKTKVTIDYTMPPLLGMCTLLATGVLTPQETWERGVVGDKFIAPYSIVILFISLAYVCIFLDHTGALSFAALHVTQRAGSSGRKLFFFVFVLSSLFTLVTSNDIVILTLTPIVRYTTLVAGIDPLPFLFAEFYAANIVSMTLLVGNPTNIIVGEAADVSFIEYTRWMGLPGVVSMLAAQLGLCLFYLQQIPRSFTAPPVEPELALVDKQGAVFGTVVLAVTLLCLGMASLLSSPLWAICLAAAVLCATYSVLRYPWTLPTNDAPPTADLSVNSAPIPSVKPPPNISITSSYHSRARPVLMIVEPTPEAVELVDFVAVSPVAADLQPPPEDAAHDRARSAPALRPIPEAAREDACDDDDDDDSAELYALAARAPSIRKALYAVPWRVVPFVFSMFVLVAGLEAGGWVERLANLVVDLIAVPSSHAFAGAEGSALDSAVFRSSFLLTVVTIVLSNVINNQPATILLTRLLLTPRFSALPRTVRSAGMFGVVLGSNLSANYTLIGSLAGIMFAGILAQKGITLHYGTFARVGITIMPFVSAAAALVVAVQWAYL